LEGMRRFALGEKRCIKNIRLQLSLGDSRVAHYMILKMILNFTIKYTDKKIGGSQALSLPLGVNNGRVPVQGCFRQENQCLT